MCPDRGRYGLRLVFAHRSDFDAIEGGKKNGSASIACSHLSGFSLFLKLGKLREQGFLACFDRGKIGWFRRRSRHLMVSKG